MTPTPTAHPARASTADAAVTCLTCPTIIRRSTGLRVCGSCYGVAKRVMRRQYDARPEDQQGPTEWQRAFNAFWSQTDAVVAAVVAARREGGRRS